MLQSDGFPNPNPMNAENIHVILLKLEEGTRVLRRTEPAGGLSLVKGVDSNQPALAQKVRMQELFGASMEHALASAA